MRTRDFFLCIQLFLTGYWAPSAEPPVIYHRGEKKTFPGWRLGNRHGKAIPMPAPPKRLHALKLDQRRFGFKLMWSVCFPTKL